MQGPRAIRAEGGDIYRARIELAPRLARTTDGVTETIQNLSNCFNDLSNDSINASINAIYRQK